MKLCDDMIHLKYTTTTKKFGGHYMCYASETNEYTIQNEKYNTYINYKSIYYIVLKRHILIW